MLVKSNERLGRRQTERWARIASGVTAAGYTFFLAWGRGPN